MLLGPWNWRYVLGLEIDFIFKFINLYLVFTETIVYLFSMLNPYLSNIDNFPWLSNVMHFFSQQSSKMTLGHLHTHPMPFPWWLAEPGKMMGSQTPGSRFLIEWLWVHQNRDDPGGCNLARSFLYRLQNVPSRSQRWETFKDLKVGLSGWHVTPPLGVLFLRPASKKNISSQLPHKDKA